MDIRVGSDQEKYRYAGRVRSGNKVDEEGDR
jgi:hypothetical protein